jgi:hypothetical protein
MQRRVQKPWKFALDSKLDLPKMQKNLKTLEIYMRLKAPTIQDAAEESENARNSHHQI